MHQSVNSCSRPLCSRSGSRSARSCCPSGKRKTITRERLNVWAHGRRAFECVGAWAASISPLSALEVLARRVPAHAVANSVGAGQVEADAESGVGGAEDRGPDLNLAGPVADLADDRGALAWVEAGNGEGAEGDRGREFAARVGYTGTAPACLRMRRRNPRLVNSTTAPPAVSPSSPRCR